MFTFLVPLYFILLPTATAQYNHPIEVLAIEYPPFTSKSAVDSGLAFQALSAHAPNYRFKSTFQPPARAAKLIQNRQWCVSFYPPITANNNIEKFILDDVPIKLGLFRKHKNTAFSWHQLSELNSRKVAVLRTLNDSGINGRLNDAGLILQQVESIKEGLKLLAKDRVDFAFADEKSGFSKLIQLGLKPENFQFSQRTLITESIHVWLNIDCPFTKELRDQMTKFHHNKAPNTTLD